MAPRRFGFLPQRRPAGRGGLARRGATSPCAAGWLLFLANIRSAQSYALSIGLCPRGRMFIFVDDRPRRRLGRFSVSPRRRPSLRPPKPAWAFSGSPHGARVCGGFDCFLGRLFWRCSFSPFGRASGFFFAWLRPSFCPFRAAAFTLLFSAGDPACFCKTGPRGQSGASAKPVRIRRFGSFHILNACWFHLFFFLRFGCPGFAGFGATYCRACATLRISDCS